MSTDHVSRARAAQVRGARATANAHVLDAARAADVARATANANADRTGYAANVATAAARAAARDYR